MVQTAQRRRRAVRAVLIGILMVVAVLVVAAFAAMRSMRARPATAAQLTGRDARQPLDVALEITGVDDGRYAGRFLQPAEKAVYQRSGRILSFKVDGHPKIMMGSVPDLHPGAVIMAHGRVRDGASVDVDRIVILTGYVRVR